MTVQVNQDLILLRAKLADTDQTLQNVKVQHDFWFDGDGVETDFVLPLGWEVVRVFVNGSLQRPGSSNHYTTDKKVGVDTVTFGTAPGSVDICITAQFSIKAAV